MTDREMVAVAHEGLLLGPTPMLRYYPAGRRADAEGVVMSCWGPVGPALNKVKVIGPAPPLTRILEIAGEFFGPDSGGFGVVVEAVTFDPPALTETNAGFSTFAELTMESVSVTRVDTAPRRSKDSTTFN